MSMAAPMPSSDDETGRCPHCGTELDARILAALNPVNAPKLSPQEWEARHRADMTRRGTVPALADYRRAYDNLAERHGAPPVTDEQIRDRHLVTE